MRFISFIKRGIGASLILTQTIFAQQVDYMDFTSYGFKQKFVKDASYNNTPFFRDLNYINGYKYTRDNGKSFIEARLEIYKGQCTYPDAYKKELENFFRTIDNDYNFYKDIKIETYYSPFSWLIFKAHGIRKNVGNNEYHGFVNAYLSNDYFVLVQVLMINYDYWNIGYEIVADKTTGDSFIPFDISQKLPHLGIKINAQGAFSINYREELQTYYFIPCTENPDDKAFFALGEYQGEYEKNYAIRILDFLNAQKNGQIETFETKTEIPWTDKGKMKFKNGVREKYAFYRLDKENNQCLQYEIFYQFEYLNKKYLVYILLFLKKDAYLYGFENSDLNTPRNKIDVLNYYEKNIIRILETMEKL